MVRRRRFLQREMTFVLVRRFSLVMRYVLYVLGRGGLVPLLVVVFPGSAVGVVTHGHSMRTSKMFSKAFVSPFAGVPEAPEVREVTGVAATEAVLHGF